MSLLAQTNEPVKLAIVAESPVASTVCDVLTAQLSANGNVRLLERDEIDKIYHEQGMSLENRDDVKLGRLLGADGLLMLEVEILTKTNPISRQPQQTTNLTTRLIAVKPGVILSDEKFSAADFMAWSSEYENHLVSFLPKLILDPGSAIPISVVNLRSAISSEQEIETEKELKSLVIQRLSREQRFFVLERERMQEMEREKGFNADESAFWDGSYLLEGTVDQNGYSSDVITMDVRLTPPKGGAPLSFQVSGVRTNLAEVINQMADKIAGLLSVKSAVPEWSATDEASKFFVEAKWALKWGAYPEAEAAADSAWALGKQDVECANIRVEAYVSELSANIENLQTLDATYGPTYNAEGQPTNHPSAAEIQSDINYELSRHPSGIIYAETHTDTNTTVVQYAYLEHPPSPENINQAIHVLELYLDFCRNSPDGQPKVLWRGPGWNDWHDSDWYKTGINGLAAASLVLQNFYISSASTTSSADQLAGLRSLARSVAALISQPPTVHDSYFVGNRAATSDELIHTIQENPNIFDCEVNWACFWQERPEDTIGVYRELLASPVFCYLHGDFWDRKFFRPRLIAWNTNDENRIPALWGKFLNELNTSTNVLWQMEAMGLARAEAHDDQTRTTVVNAWWKLVRLHHAELVANNVDLFYLGWGFDYDSESEAMNQEYWQNTVPALKAASVFDQQKEYLSNNTPYDFMKFVQLFESDNYSQEQAHEILPLIIAYKSNLVAQSQSLPMMQKMQLMGGIDQVGFLQDDVNRILNPPKPVAVSTIKAPSPQVVQPVHPIVPKPAPVEIETNVTVVNRFIQIPAGDFFALQNSETLNFSNIIVTAHQVVDGKLIFDLHYVGEAYSDMSGQRNIDGSAIALFDLGTETWVLIDCPQGPDMNQNNYYHRTALVRSELYHADAGKIWKYDRAGEQWHPLPISDGNDYELFAVNGHLYGANESVVFEIADDGNTTHILASTRRQPPMSSLDPLDLGTPVLFEGPGDSLRAGVARKLFTWTNNDWREDCDEPKSEYPPEIVHGGVLFRSESSLGNISQCGLYFLAETSNAPAIWLWQKHIDPNTIVPRMQYQDAGPPSGLFWEMPSQFDPQTAAVAFNNNRLCLFIDHTKQVQTSDQSEFSPQNGYQAALLNFSKGLASPQQLFLNFNSPEGRPPVGGKDVIVANFQQVIPSWILISGQNLIFGQEFPRSRGPESELDSFGRSYKAGIWVTPLSEIDTAIAPLKKSQLDQTVKDQTIAELVQKRFLAKYDLNHNGVIDADEKGAALIDPTFIETALDAIDSNHNGVLDPEELAFFDANTNKTLDPNEQAGIFLAQTALAAKDLKEFDANGDGFLDTIEFAKFITKNGLGVLPDQDPLFFRYSHNPKGLDANGLEEFLKHQTFMELRAKILPGPMGHLPSAPTPDKYMSLTAAINAYWQNPRTLKTTGQSH